MTLEKPQAAFLLHSRPYKEQQLLVELLTEYDGKVSAVVYSGKTAKSNKKAILQPFLPLQIEYKGKSALKKLSLVEATGKALNLHANYLYSGFYLNELLVRLLGELIPCSELYQQYVNSLQALQQGQAIEPILRCFELVLLEELGQTIDFSVLLASEAENFYYFHEQGFVPATTNSPQQCYNKNKLLSMAAHDFSEQEVCYQAKLLMRQIMSPLLGNKPLNSRKLFKTR